MVGTAATVFAPEPSATLSTMFAVELAPIATAAEAPANEFVPNAIALIALVATIAVVPIAIPLVAPVFTVARPIAIEVVARAFEPTIPSLLPPPNATEPTPVATASLPTAVADIFVALEPEPIAVALIPEAEASCPNA